MRNPFSGFAVLIVLVIAIVIGSSSFFTITPIQQAVVLRFGEPVAGRSVVKEPGLHWKYPFIDTVEYLDNRVLNVDSPRQEVIAADNNRIEVDAFLRYRITDPLQFYRSVRNEQRAANQLGSVLNSAVRRVLGDANMPQIVREDRGALMTKIQQQVNEEAKRLGVSILDVRIKRADLPQQISEKVYSRMQTERQQEAAEFRAKGAEEKQKIESRADRDAVVLRAEAQRKAQEIRGQGDAERNRIFAAAFGKDPEFFAFYRSMQAYEKGLASGDTRMVISPNSEFFRYFGNPMGIAPNGTKPAASGTTGNGASPASPSAAAAPAKPAPAAPSPAPATKPAPKPAEPAGKSGAGAAPASGDGRAAAN